MGALRILRGRGAQSGLKHRRQADPDLVEPLHPVQRRPSLWMANHEHVAATRHTCCGDSAHHPHGGLGRISGNQRLPRRPLVDDPRPNDRPTHRSTPPRRNRGHGAIVDRGQHRTTHRHNRHTHHIAELKRTAVEGNCAKKGSIWVPKHPISGRISGVIGREHCCGRREFAA
jgi:hypothetical protein